MLKVYNKIKRYSLEENVQIGTIASYLGVSRQTIWGWKNRPIKYKDAVKLVYYMNGYIKMKDCGYE